MKTIKEPSQMSRPLIWVPVSDEWKASLTESHAWWYMDKPVGKTPGEQAAMDRMALLREKLLSFGGEIACMPIDDPDYGAIMERGQFWYGDHAKMKRGEPCRCHENAALLWASDRSRLRIATGYALSADGCWRQHSWAVQEMPRSWRIYETTTPRIGYFGAVLTEDECEEFLGENAW